jgi:hypothetical protein
MSLLSTFVATAKGARTAADKVDDRRTWADDGEPFAALRGLT